MSAPPTSPISFTAAQDTYSFGFEALKASVLAVSAAETPELRQTALDACTDCLASVGCPVLLSSPR
jgi:hypothetical protein